MKSIKQNIILPILTILFLVIFVYIIAKIYRLYVSKEGMTDLVPKKIIDYAGLGSNGPPEKLPVKCHWGNVEKNTDYPYHDMANYHNKSVDDCKKLCENRQGEGCKGIVYAEKEKECWLKNDMNSHFRKNNKPDRDSYFLSAGCPYPCACYDGYLIVNEGGCGSVGGAPCCRHPNGHVWKPFCNEKHTTPPKPETPCGCYEGYVEVNQSGCGSVGGAPCCRHPNGHVWKPFCNKKSNTAPAPTGKCVPNVPALALVGNPALDVIAGQNCPKITSQGSCGPLGAECPACCTWVAAPPKPTTTGKCVPNVPALAQLGNAFVNIIAAKDCPKVTSKGACGPIGAVPAACAWVG